MVRDCCVNHVATGYLLFSAEQPDDLRGLNEQLTKELAPCVSNYRNLLLTQDLMIEQLQRLERLNILNKSGLELLYKHMKSLQTAVGSVEVLFFPLGKKKSSRFFLSQKKQSSGLLVEPGIFDKLMLSAMFIYLMLWIPFQQWALYGWILLVVAWPIEMMLIVNIIIARKW